MHSSHEQNHKKGLKMLSSSYTFSYSAEDGTFFLEFYDVRDAMRYQAPKEHKDGSDFPARARRLHGAERLVG